MARFAASIGGSEVVPVDTMKYLYLQPGDTLVGMTAAYGEAFMVQRRRDGARQLRVGRRSRLGTEVDLPELSPEREQSGHQHRRMPNGQGGSHCDETDGLDQDARKQVLLGGPGHGLPEQVGEQDQETGPHHAWELRQLRQR